jgi:hypothetical protein
VVVASLHVFTVTYLKPTAFNQIYALDNLSLYIKRSRERLRSSTDY